MEETYREEQLREQGLIYFRGDILATNVWISKYALKNKLGEYKELTPDDTIKRLTREIERIESKYPNSLSYNQIYEALKDFKYFIFGGSVIFGLGNDEQISSLGNCFFIDNGSDSYGGIFQLEESMVQLMKRRGGVGITLEHLRPETSLVNNAAKTSTGLVSFMDRFSNGTREVAQDGRRGALMISCHVDHPDIIKFINKKDDPTKVTGANVSVKVTDKFMEAVERDEDYYLCWPIKDKKPDIKENLPYNSLHVLEDGSHVRRVKAKEVWNNIIRQAHKNAEPGVLFWDNIIMSLEKNRQDSSNDLVEQLYSMTNISTDASNLERINRWNCAIRMFQEKPILGFGPATYMFQYAPYQISSEKTIISTNFGEVGNAHSEYLGALAESGLLGALSYLLILIAITATAFKIYHRAKEREIRRLAMAIFLGLSTYFVHGFLNNFLDIDKFSLVFWGFAAFLVALDVFYLENQEFDSQNNRENHSQ